MSASPRKHIWFSRISVKLSMVLIAGGFLIFVEYRGTGVGEGMEKHYISEGRREVFFMLTVS